MHDARFFFSYDMIMVERTGYSGSQAKDGI